MKKGAALLLALCISLSFFYCRISDSADTKSSSQQTENPEPVPVTKPVAPTDLNANPVSFERIDLSWKDNSDNESSFEIERTSGGVTTKLTVNKNTTSYIDRSLIHETTYTYTIKAVNTIGYSESCTCTPASVTTLALPKASFIADHTIAKESILRKIPDSAIENAKTKLRIAYFHTSHGSRIITGMEGLLNYKTGDSTKWAFTKDGSVQSGKLSIDDHWDSDNAPDLSVGETIESNGHTRWYNKTVTYLSSHASINVVMWSWCDPATHNHDKYISEMENLIKAYPAITFVFMTGHPNGDGEVATGNSAYQCHTKVRSHCIDGKRFCVDYWDIETHGMDDTYYPRANDNGVDQSNSTTFYLNWQTANPGMYFANSCQHCSDNQELTCNRKAYAAWYLWAIIAGWDGTLNP